MATSDRPHAYRRQVAAGPQLMSGANNNNGGGIVIREPGAAGGRAGSGAPRTAEQRLMDADEQLALQLQAKLDAQEAAAGSGGGIR